MCGKSDHCSPTSPFELSRGAHLLVTAANVQAHKYTRDLEYMHGFAWVRSTGLPSSVVVSENAAAWPVLNSVTWKLKLHYTSTRRGKSAKEVDCIRQLVQALARGSTIANDTMIFKLSGRYHVVRNDVLDLYQHHPEIDMIAKEDRPHNQVYTFFFGLKWNYFQDFYMTSSLDELESVNVEKKMFDYAKKKKLVIRLVDRLWVIGNIGNTGLVNVY